ncbi:MAG: hypothetical protein ACKO0Z_25905 [Betaproteobacteria bacterium]
MLSLAQIRQVDPILSQIAIEYTARPRSASALFPLVPVNVRGGKVLEFGKESFRLYNTKRAPGADVKVIEYGKYGSKDFVLETNDLDALVPIEHLQEARAVPGIDLASRATNQVLDSMLLGWENECAALASNAANYPVGNTVALAGPTQWNTADVAAQITAAKEVLRMQIGQYPNTLLIGGKVLAGLMSNANLKDTIKYTQTGVVTEGLLSSLLQVPRVVTGTSVRFNEATNQFEDLWANVAVLAYVGSGNDRGAPSFGYTYNYQGHPQIETPWYDRIKKSWRYGVKFDYKPVIAGNIAGYLFTNVVA